MATFKTLLVGRYMAGRWAGFHSLVYLLGVALLGWGVSDLRGFFSHPVRLSFAGVVIVYGLVQFFLVIRFPARVRLKILEENEHWHYTLTQLISILAAYGDKRDVVTWMENPTMRWAGIGVIGLAAIYSTWANWTWVSHVQHAGESAQPDPALISNGPFRWTRYPILLILFLYASGIALIFCSWMGLILLVPLVGIIAKRLHYWEKSYPEHYGKEWTSRRQTSKRIIPFLY